MTISHVFSHKLLRLGIVLFSLILIVSVSRSIVDVWYKRDVIADREAQLQKVQEKNKQLQEQLTQTKSAEFVEEEARKLGMLKEGESVVVIPEQSMSSFGQSANKNMSHWKQWWQLFW